MIRALAVAVKSINIVMEVKKLVSRIDYTLLKYDARLDEVKQLCREADENGYYSVCVSPYFVRNAVMYLMDSEVKVTTVASFPFGNAATSVKVEEVKRAFIDGAEEIDVVMNMSALKSGDKRYFENDIQSVTTIAHLHNMKIKIIIETGSLDEKEIEYVCGVCANHGVDFVKTSTGVNTEGVTVDVIKFIRSVLPRTIRVKASGGIRSSEFAEELVRAGASRIGTSTALK